MRSLLIMECLTCNAQFEDIYHTHHQWLHSLLSKRLGNQEDAADIAHDTFVRYWNRSSLIEGEEQTRAYLSVIAKRLCIDLWRRRGLEQSWLDTLEANALHDPQSMAYHPSVIENLSEAERILEQLPEPVANTFVLSTMYQKTGKEISLELGVSVRTVRNYLAHPALKAQLLEVRLER